MEAKPLEHVPDLLPSMELAGKVEPIPGEYILQLTNSPMGYLVASTSTHSVLLMDPSTLTTVRQLQGHGAPVTDMVARDHLLLTSCEDGCVRVWDLRVQDLSGPMQVLQGTSPRDASRLSLLNISVNVQGHALAAGSSMESGEAFIPIWDVRQGTVVRTLEESHSEDITQIHFHPSSPSILLSSSEDGLLCTHDLTQTEEEDALGIVCPTSSSVSRSGWFGPDASGSHLYSLNRIETLSLWDAQEADQIADFGDIRRYTQPTLQLDYAVDCHFDPISQRLFLLAGAFHGGPLHILHVNVGSLQYCTSLAGGHSDLVRSILWGADPSTGSTSTLYTGGEDGLICVWQSARALE